MKKKRVSKKIIFLVISVAIVILTITGFWLFPTRDVEEYTTALVEKRPLVQTVSEVGSIKSAQIINLNFSQPGKLNRLFVKVGDKVKAEQILAELDYRNLIIQQSEAESRLVVAQANLRKVKFGATKEEIAVVEAQNDQARENYYAALDNLEKTKAKVEDAIAQAEKSYNDLSSSAPGTITSQEQAVSSAEKDLSNIKATYQNSIDNKEEALMTVIGSKLSLANTALDSVFIIIDNNDIKDYLSSKNTSYLTATKLAHTEAENLLAKANTSFNLANSNKIDPYVTTATNDANAALNKTAETLDLCFSVLELSTLNETVLNAYKASISADITSMNTAISALELASFNLNDAKLAYTTNVSTYEEILKKAQVALSDAVLNAKNALSSTRIAGDKEIAQTESSVTSAKKSWDVAVKQLAQLKAPARREDVDLYEANVKQAQSSLDLISKQIEDSVIRAPISGRITAVEYEIGEQVSQAKQVISMLAENDLEIEVDVSESDIAKINVGNLAEITLDAFGEDTIFKGSVVFIEPAETVIQDVIYYKLKIKFDEEPDKLENVKSGMTANVTITTDIKENVLVIPSRAILEKDNNKYIRVWRDGQVTENLVDVGLRGDGGYVEIFDHVKEGDEVVTYVKLMKKRVFRY